VFAQPLPQFQAGQAAHADIQDGEVGPGLGADPHGFLGGFGLADAISRFAQSSRHGAQDEQVVIHQEEVGLAHEASSP
jgi:L-aminopeptidase/D-esterase-like protein